MKLSDISIKRPVFAIVINILLILLGLIGLDRISIREYPDIDVPVISIRTTYQGASPEIVETQVTKILEDAVTSIDGIDFITSDSRRGFSSINITFNPTKNIEEAANDVRDRVARAKRGLPDEVDDPIIQKSDSDADPVVILALSSDQYNAIELTNMIETIVQPQIELLEGVANVTLWGGRKPVMRVWIDPQKLAILDVTVSDVEAALRAQNVEIPAGTIKSSTQEFSIVARTDLNQVDEFRNIIIKVADNAAEENRPIVRLSDVALVELGGVDETSRPRLNGKPGVGVAIIKQSVANPLTLSADIRALLPQLQESLPGDVEIAVTSDSSVFINKSLTSVYNTIVEALLFVGVIIFLFLRDWRATLIPMVTVPISLIGTLFAMYLLNYSINTLTLLAFVLAIGLVVDDAIVMLENIHRHIAEGLSPLEAAFKGSKEIGFAIIAMTITLAAVFLPLTFTQGRIGQLFVEFAVTLSITVLISGFTALTLSPMMCSRLLKPESDIAKRGAIARFFAGISQWIEALLEGMTKVYSAILRFCLQMRYLVLVGMVLFLGGAYLLYQMLPQELSPTEDRGMIRVAAITPEGATVDFTDRYFSEVEEYLLDNLDEGTVVYAISGISMGALGFVTLPDWDDREESQMEITSRLNRGFQDIALGLRVFASNPQSLGQRGDSKDVQIVIRSNESFQKLDQQVTEIMERMRENDLLISPDNDLRMNTPQLEVAVDREKLALLGIDVSVVGRTLESALGGRNVTRFKEGAEQYDVMVQVDPQKRSQPKDLEGIYVRSKYGEMVPLSNIVTVTETIAPQNLRHFNKLRSVTISANLQSGVSQGEGIALVEEIIREVILDAMLDYQGSSREFLESGSSMLFIFVMALLFIYLVLAAQFESWIDPFIILLSVPLAGFGALGALYLSGGTINIYSQIGLVTLVGLITKHGILIVEFANQIRATGIAKREAIIEAATLRLRPILMTTGAMVLGAVPLALSVGAGAESRSAIGWVIVGGMSIGTLLTLIVVPVIYLFIGGRKRELIVT
ncbi:efflux RND transporter permease subunit [Ignatzschineria cameli]|uniref:Multidrug transporter AcrB n=2 Tax=Bacteria TaxID=2 RepID=A0A2U2AKY8_9GAMM|nr:efflux RND transporter permease subunit [Ignatzschineria cameli]PWD83822.1 multidrug transporter AcrB [Ignatzschineria cameli]PWD86096.1 multidrug transporter AcrB [Ignatzschineria cameli]PWD88393.1 multidrug transporter AcrB [Ignatzschineria cameli]PWD88903.1 multidrug transporter AcrB [Ignatzschineria cameli]PWD89620.1 multidrug transporter AcrB [Ignatzschineria cameli]